MSEALSECYSQSYFKQKKISSGCIKHVNSSSHLLIESFEVFILLLFNREEAQECILV